VLSSLCLLTWSPIRCAEDRRLAGVAGRCVYNQYTPYFTLLPSARYRSGAHGFTTHDAETAGDADLAFVLERLLSGGLANDALCQSQPLDRTVPLAHISNTQTDTVVFKHQPIVCTRRFMSKTAQYYGYVVP
jgi:hypothetical protein